MTQISTAPGRRLHRFPAELPDGTAPVGTKGRILTSALAAFADRGFYGTSIRTIADGAGINSATLYSHYPSKDHILAALVTIGSAALLQRIDTALESAGSCLERLDAIIRATAMGHALFPLLAVVTNSEIYALSPDLVPAAVAPTTKSAEHLRSALADGRAEQTFESEHSDVATHVLEGMSQRIPQWISRETDSPEAIADAYVAIARRIVLTR